MEKLQPQSGI